MRRKDDLELASSPSRPSSLRGVTLALTHQATTPTIPPSLYLSLPFSLPFSLPTFLPPLPLVPPKIYLARVRFPGAAVPSHPRQTLNESQHYCRRHTESRGPRSKKPPSAALLAWVFSSPLLVLRLCRVFSRATSPVYRVPFFLPHNPRPVFSSSSHSVTVFFCLCNLHSPFPPPHRRSFLFPCSPNPSSGLFPSFSFAREKYLLPVTSLFLFPFCFVRLRCFYVSTFLF